MTGPWEQLGHWLNEKPFHLLGDISPFGASALPLALKLRLFGPGSPLASATGRNDLLGELVAGNRSLAGRTRDRAEARVLAVALVVRADPGLLLIDLAGGGAGSLPGLAGVEHVGGRGSHSARAGVLERLAVSLGKGGRRWPFHAAVRPDTYPGVQCLAGRSPFRHRPVPCFLADDERSPFDARCHVFRGGAVGV